MTQNFIQPKGSLNTQVDTSNLQSQLAQMFANQQLQNQAQAQANSEDETRQTVNELLKKKLIADVEMPQFTTIQDIFKAPTGRKLETFGQFLNTPNGQNALGSIASLLTGGRYYTTPADAYNQQLQRDMAVKQSQAMQQMKEQNDIATALNSAYMQSDLAKERNQLQRDLAKEEMEFKKEQAALDRALQEKQLNADIQYKNGMLGIAKQKLISGGGSSGGRILPASITQDLSGTLQGIQQMNDLYDYIPNLAERLTTPGAAQAATWNPWDTDAQAFKQYVKTYKQVIGKGLEGGVLRKEDEAKYEDIIPKVGDTRETLTNKTQTLGKMLVDKYNSNMDFYGAAGYNTSRIQDIPVPKNFLNQQSNTVRVRRPDGKVGTIPRANLQKAIQRGYKEIK